MVQITQHPFAHLYQKTQPALGTHTLYRKFKKNFLIYQSAERYAQSDYEQTFGPRVAVGEVSGLDARCMIRVGGSQETNPGLSHNRLGVISRKVWPLGRDSR